MRNTDFYFESSILNPIRQLLKEKNLDAIVIIPKQGDEITFKIIDVKVKGRKFKEIKQIEWEAEWGL